LNGAAVALPAAAVVCERIDPCYPPLMNIVPIDDPGDPRLAPYRNIRERYLAGDGLFVAEGKVVLNVLFAARRFEPRSVLLLESRLAGMAETLRNAPAALPVYVAPPSIMDTVAGFKYQPGLMAADQPPPPQQSAHTKAPLPPEAVWGGL
jgi:hypothetical protein